MENQNADEINRKTIEFSNEVTKTISDCLANVFSSIESQDEVQGTILRANYMIKLLHGLCNSLEKTIEGTIEETLKFVLGPAESRDREEEVALRKFLSEDISSIVQDVRPNNYHQN